MIISLDSEKAFDKIEHYDKSPGEIRHASDIQQHNEDSLQQGHSQYQLFLRETHSNFIKIRNKTSLSTLSTPFQYST